MNRHHSALSRRVLRQGCAFGGLEYLIFAYLPIFDQKSSKLSPKWAICSQNAETTETKIQDISENRKPNAVNI